MEKLIHLGVGLAMFTEFSHESVLVLQFFKVVFVDLAEGISESEHALHTFRDEDESRLYKLTKVHKVGEEVPEAAVDILSIVKADLVTVQQD